MFGVPENQAEWLIQFVGNTRDESAQGRELLGLHELLMSGLEFGQRAVQLSICLLKSLGALGNPTLELLHVGPESSLEGYLFQGSLNGDLQYLDVKWLRNIVIGPIAYGFNS